MSPTDRLGENVGAWLHFATGPEIITLLNALGAELITRKWPTSASCFLAAAELRRFVSARALRQIERV